MNRRFRACARLASAALLAASCVQSPAAEEPSAAPAASPDPAPPPCAAVATDALAIIDTDECPLQLRPLDGGLILHGLGAQPPAALKGVLPPPCEERPCQYEGVATALGPLVLASVVSAESEMPAGAWLGASVADRIRFVDLWAGAGDAVEADGTDLGPAFSLAPHDCGGTLTLLVVARLPAGEGAAAPAPLRAREGRMIVGSSGEIEIEPVADARRCAALPLPIP